ncbi:MAG: GNAT family N-acetyltransferase [Acidimicrobiales bacterium]
MPAPAPVEVVSTDDAAAAWHAAGPYLLADPVRHNRVLSLLDTMVDDPAGAAMQGARTWWATPSAGTGPPTGVCLRTAADQPVVIAADDRPTVFALVDAVADGLARIPGISGEAAASIAFAGTWASFRHVAAKMAVAQRFYRLDNLVPAPEPKGGGSLRPGTPADLSLLTHWAVAFQHDTFGPGVVDSESLARFMARKIDYGLAWVWHTTEPVAMAAATPTAAGVSRIQHVYTPPRFRGRGYAASCVSAVAADRLAAGAEQCVLFTDLLNPTSNAVYQRLGFEPVSEHLEIDFV